MDVETTATAPPPPVVQPTVNTAAPPADVPLAQQPASGTPAGVGGSHAQPAAGGGGPVLLRPTPQFDAMPAPQAMPAESPSGADDGIDQVQALALALRQREQQLLDRLTPYKMERWIAFGITLAIFIARMFIVHGYYIVTYVLFIFLLNQLILFMQPKDRARLLTDGPGLPTTDSDDYRPFYRLLPEFKFWYSAMRATVLSFFCTFFPIFDVPVFWPVLVIYFVVLFFATMRRQIMDMKRFKYVPWDIGKPKANPKVVSSAPRESPVPNTQTSGGRKKATAE